MIALSIDALRFRFPAAASDLFAIDSLTLVAGSTLGIRGASGAGKTTFLHCLSAIEAVTAGRICWGETEISRLSPSAATAWRRKNLGLIFQDFHLVDGLSALDNLLLPAYFADWQPDAALRARALALLQAVGIDKPGARIDPFSRGERQRVAVARALLFAPPFVLADEPTASLDPENRAIVGELLCRLVREQGATLIVISHDSNLLERMDHHMELRQGQLKTENYPCPTHSPFSLPITGETVCSSP